MSHDRSQDKNSRQVYSSDAKLNQVCKTCRQLIRECRCPKDGDVALDKVKVCLSLEKSGRGGKTVTLISQLPAAESFLKPLLSELKQKCGAGGTSYVDPKKGGCIEIQGDKRDFLREYLIKRNIRVKN